MPIEKICGNCIHCDFKNVVEVPLYVNGRHFHEFGLPCFNNFYPCKVMGHDIDVAYTVALVQTETPASDDCSFEASADAIFEEKDAQLYAKDPATYNGVVPGVDFPASFAGWR